MKTYTPGPWTVELDADGNTINICSDTLPYVASTWGDGSSPTIEQAFNARLISAAPEMMQVLRELWDMLTSPNDMRSDALDLIKKTIDKIEG